ncbi:MAG TPA: hypothetical protein VNQ76_14940 [Planctomicrobium sp.]|nr:hypothetical protein [Planctomicrobium sp.]
MQNINKLILSICTVLMLAGGATGCGSSPPGPQTSPVKGRVTLDDQPLPDAVVEFVPAQGRPSIAITDSNGNYVLKYTQTADGAMTGISYTVKITTGREASASEGVEVEAAVPEKVPAKYNASSELATEIQHGENVLNFDLKSK